MPDKSGGLHLKKAIKDKTARKAPVTDQVAAEGKALKDLKNLPDPKNLGHRGMKNKKGSAVNKNVKRGRTAPAKMFVEKKQSSSAKKKSDKSAKKSSGKASKNKKAPAKLYAKKKQSSTKKNQTKKSDKKKKTEKKSGKKRS